MLEDLERELRGMLKGEFSSLTLTFNDGNGPNYMSVEEFDREGHYDFEWVSEEEREKAIEANSVWELQWYPHTPIGSYSIAASSLPTLFAAMREHADG